MTEEARNVDELKPAAAKRIREALAEEPRWKKVMLIGAIVFIVIGFVLLAIEGGASETGDGPLNAQGAPQGTPGGPGAGFTDGGVRLPPGEQAESGEADGETWAPVFLRFGFSFFVGFALGAAARTVFRLLLLFVGLFAGLLFGFSELGWVEVHWDAMGVAFDSFVAKIGEEAGSLRGFFTGRLPSAGLAMLGLYAGFRRG